MADCLIVLTRCSLPSDHSTLLKGTLQQIESGRYESILSSSLVRLLLGHDDDESTENVRFDSSIDAWNDYVFRRLGAILAKRDRSLANAIEDPLELRYFYFLVAIAALQAFIQSSVTGPPLPFESAQVLFLGEIVRNDGDISTARKTLIRSLSVDSEAAYSLTPNVELFCLADAILTCPPIVKSVSVVPWARMRLDFIHQQLLNDTSPTLQSSIYENMHLVDAMVSNHIKLANTEHLQSELALECAAIHIHFGYEKLAGQELRKAAKQRQFEYRLTGRLGKRTKYQEEDLSQLIVLARSHVTGPEQDSRSTDNHASKQRPQNLDLNDDTLLESISFKESPSDASTTQDQNALPRSLASLDPSQQPLLEPLDAAILLSTASSITNTSPADGITREETLPYVTRVLEGGSSNWQIYTHALLLRSRIEGYRSRTTERGLLQLQALVDQVIAETSSSNLHREENGVTSFLPLPKPSESAPVSERLRYIFQLNTPTKWKLEAELAARWVSLGGLRSALDIYERLQMWAEAALCWAATDREGKAERIIRKQIFYATTGDAKVANPDEETWLGPPREPPPNDAARLYCILGDLTKDLQMYEKAWDISNGRYARAQRSLGRYYFTKDNFIDAAAAYTKSLRVNQLNQTSWFALGCALLKLLDFDKAAEAFSRAVQLDESDAEAWSNLATALLHKDRSGVFKKETPAVSNDVSLDSEIDDENASSVDIKQNALKALKRAATLKHDSSRIWENLLTVAASLSPPAYADIIAAQKRIIQLRGPLDGENCIDVDILELLTRHVMTTSESFVPKQDQRDGLDHNTSQHPRGIPRMLIDMIDKEITPFITSSTRLWTLVAQLAIWRDRPASALVAYEKAWRAATLRPGWENGREEQFDEVADVTIELVDAYESLGEREKNEGMALGSGELVAKDWRLKASSAIRGVLGKASSSWEGTPAYQRLSERLDDLKAA